MSPLNNALSGHRPTFILSALWLIIQTYLLYRFGVETSFESIKYIAQAQELIATGRYESTNFLFYSVEILLIAACIKSGVGFWAVVAFQLLLNALSQVAFYRLCIHLTQNTKAAFFATAALTIMVYYQLYNTHLFTESIFFSCSIMYSYYLLTKNDFTLRYVIVITLGLCILTFTRPTGLLFIPPTIIFLVLRFQKQRSLLLLSVLGACAFTAFFFLLNGALGSGGELDFLLPYTEAHIICGIPTAQGNATITVPVTQNSVQGLWYIITHHSDLFLRLAGKRLLAFWGLLRPYYSPGHNLFIGIYFYTLYIFIVVGAKRFLKKFTSAFVFFSVYVLLIMLTVMLSCDEWHNRFIYSILPFLILLALGSLTHKQLKM